jgi:hypothetical protein
MRDFQNNVLTQIKDRILMPAFGPAAIHKYAIIRSNGVVPDGFFLVCMGI